MFAPPSGRYSRPDASKWSAGSRIRRQHRLEACSLAKTNLLKAHPASALRHCHVLDSSPEGYRYRSTPQARPLQSPRAACFVWMASASHLMSKEERWLARRRLSNGAGAAAADPRGSDKSEPLDRSSSLSPSPSLSPSLWRSEREEARSAASSTYAASRCRASQSRLRLDFLAAAAAATAAGCFAGS